MSRFLGTLDGVVYEGEKESWQLPGATVSMHPVHPTPLLFKATFMPRVYPVEEASKAQQYLFREESYDAHTRIRRGRIFCTTEGSNPIRAVHGNTALAGYRALMMVTSRDKLLGTVIQLGTDDYSALWEVREVEQLVNGELLFTLQAPRAVGPLLALLLTIVAAICPACVPPVRRRGRSAAPPELTYI